MELKWKKQSKNLKTHMLLIAPLMELKYNNSSPGKS